MCVLTHSNNRQQTHCIASGVSMRVDVGLLSSTKATLNILLSARDRQRCHSLLKEFTSLIPRPIPVFQCCMLKNGRRATLKNWDGPGDEARSL